MKSFVYDTWGGPGGLRTIETGPVTLQDTQLRVRMAFAGINPVDLKFMSGKYKLIAKGGFPRRIGVEGAGHVIEAGPGTSGLQAGQAVAVSLNPVDGRMGAVAEEVVLDASGIVPIPDGISMAHAAVLPIAGATAWTMCDLARVRPGSRVLITGASGGVGTFAVQIAKERGAHVTALAGERNRELVLSLGADRFLDYHVTPPESLDEQWDVIVDCVNSARQHSTRLLASDGHYVDTDPLPLNLLGDKVRNLFGQRKFFTVMNSTNPTAINGLFGLIASGRLKPVVTEEFSFAQSVAAYTALHSGHAVGKIVIRMPA